MWLIPPMKRRKMQTQRVVNRFTTSAHKSQMLASFIFITLTGASGTHHRRRRNQPLILRQITNNLEVHLTTVPLCLMVFKASCHNTNTSIPDGQPLSSESRVKMNSRFLKKRFWSFAATNPISLNSGTKNRQLLTPSTLRTCLMSRMIWAWEWTLSIMAPPRSN